jgi:dipeptidyl aminopeptidase/acylaminoacyl peptidase
MRPSILLTLILAAVAAGRCAAQAPASPISYQKPPRAIQEVLDAPPPPGVLLAPGGDRALLVGLERYPALRELAQPMLRLAGARFNPANRAPHLPVRLRTLALMDLPQGRRREVPLPPGRTFGVPQWAPDGRAFALTGITSRAVELWLGDTTGGRLRHVPGLRLNACFGNPLTWMPGSRALLCETVPAGQARPPRRPEVPAGPGIQEFQGGRPEPVRTLPDLLKDALDEALYTHYAASQLVTVDLAKGTIIPLGRPAVFADLQVSPDGRAILAGLIHPPYSRLVGEENFPRRSEVWDRAGRKLAVVADLPLAEGIPIDGVRTGPRRIQWIPAQDASLAWVEALDGGDPKAAVPYRDVLKVLAPPYRGEARAVFRTQHRLAGLEWFPADGRVLAREYERERRRVRTWLVDLDRSGAERLVWDLSVQDRYQDPGQVVQRTLPGGQRAVLVENGRAFLLGAGATPQGDRPFLDLLDLDTLRATRRFQGAGPGLETPLAPLPGGRVLLRKESPTQPPNLVLREADGSARALTDDPDPAPALRRVHKELVRYRRPDGVELSFTLYLPPGHQQGQRHPALLWAYPLEYTDAGVAGQVSGSPERFTVLTGPSPVFMALLGYAVLMDATMPVVGDPRTVNDTYLEQVAASAQAALAKADELGVIDPARVAVGGHSYGAFMAANLLAHTTLFKAGIARSGAYNRTLTPFGFQDESRTLWEAPETYLKVSPFMEADRFHAPILLIHGEADDNPGTFPIQSERLYHALKGNGLPARYVTLPLEAHAYQARESVEHTLWEMARWLDRHL